MTAGIDIGSVATKAVILKNGRVAGRGIAATGADPKIAAEKALSDALKAAKTSRREALKKVFTGYGRRATGVSGTVITEITAAARGAFWIGAPWGKVTTVVDLGGQDTKVITLNPDGDVADFLMNDKCAAGTGRFLTFMADSLGIEIGDMGALGAKAKSPVSLTSTCAVFAESEVISLIAQRKKREDIVAGLHEAIAGRIAAMVRQMGGKEVFFMGGGAKNEGVRKALAAALHEEVYVPPEPQFVVATGAALTR